MSHQLIFTSAAELLEGGFSGYGVVAASPSIPRWLRDELLGISELKEPASKGILGPQYSYHIFRLGQEEYHVLSAVQEAGADYSGRDCYIAQHLALSWEELQDLIQRIKRPTPAGLILALQRQGFWLSRWEAAPRLLEDKPEAAPEDFPDASTQRTWKQLTGHKGNARAFLERPYDSDCLATLPEGSTSQTVLALLHESDWISGNFGWGCSFSSYAVAGDSFQQSRRLFCVAGSELEQQVRRSGRAVLCISPALELPTECIPASERDEADGAFHSTGQTPTTAAKAGPRYAYVECEDTYSYDIQPRRKWPYGAAFALLLLAASALYVYYKGDETAPPSELASTAFRQSYRQLTELCNKSFEGSDIARIHAEQRHMAESGGAGGQAALLLKTWKMLDNAAHCNANELLRSLPELEGMGEQLKLPEEHLMLLYLHAALQDENVPAWLAPINEETRELWRKILSANSDLCSHITGEAHLAPLLQILQTGDTPSTDGGETPNAELPPVEPPRGEESGEALPPAPENTQRTKAEPQADSFQLAPCLPLACKCGGIIPPPLRSALERLPQTIALGEWLIADLNDPQQSRRITLSPDGDRLRISATTAPETYLLEHLLPDGSVEEKNSLILCLEQGRLVSISRNGQPVLSLFPVNNGTDILSPVILLAPYRQSLFPQKEEGKALKQTRQARVRLRPDMVSLERRDKRLVLKLQLPAGGDFGKLLRHFSFPAKGDLLCLPMIQGHNSVNFLYSNNLGAEYQLRAKQVSKDKRNGSDSFRLELEVCHDFREALLKRFHCVANLSCCGRSEQGDPFYSLARLYALAERLGGEKAPKQKTDKEAMGLYLRLFENKRFADILRRVLAKQPALLPHEQFASLPLHIRRERQRQLAEEWKKEGAGEKVKAAIIAYLEQELSRCYQEEAAQLPKEEKPFSLELHSLVKDPDKSAFTWFYNVIPVQD